MRLAGIYCNRGREIANIRRLIADAKTLTTVRPQRGLAPDVRAPKKLTKSQNEAIVAAYASGRRMNDIAAEFGITVWTVNYRVRLAGTPYKQRSMTDAEVTWAAEQLKHGMTLKKTAALLRFAPATVRKALRSRDAG